MKRIDMSNVESAKDYKRLVPGGYVCKITGVKDVANNEYLEIEYDIAEGEFKDYYLSLFQYISDLLLRPLLLHSIFATHFLKNAHD